MKHAANPTTTPAANDTSPSFPMPPRKPAEPMSRQLMHDFECYFRRPGPHDLGLRLLREMPPSPRRDELLRRYG